MRVRVLTVLVTTCTFASAQRPSSAGGSLEHHSDLEITWRIFKPVELPAPDVSQLHVPAGFRIQRFAENIGNGRILAIAPCGNVYVTRRDEGDVLMFRGGADGLASGEPRRVASRSCLHGITFSKGKVYLPSVQEVFKADVRPDGTFGPFEMTIHDLPDAGRHNTRTVQIGPDDIMHISVGATCNECTDPQPEKRYDFARLDRWEIALDFRLRPAGYRRLGLATPDRRIVGDGQRHGRFGRQVQIEQSPRAAVVEAVVDPNEPPAKPAEVPA
jgi:glucose/arabinose dehydrogenase